LLTTAGIREREPGTAARPRRGGWADLGVADDLAGMLIGVVVVAAVEVRAVVRRRRGAVLRRLRVV
jgi:hypothetical protein